MPIVKCKICKKEFYAKPSWLKQGWGKYCSAKCQHKAQLRGKFVKCFICKKQVWKAPKALKHSKSGKYFCNKSCQTQWRNQFFVGRLHTNWIHGRSAYKTVLSRIGRERTCEICKTQDRRVLAVHHIDRVRTNIDPSNLVWLCHNCHFLVHHYDVGRDRGLLRPRS